MSQDYRLNLEITPSSHSGEWVWRLRSTSDRTGSDFLAVGSGCATEEQARKRGEAVKHALVHVYPFNDQ